MSTSATIRDHLLETSRTLGQSDVNDLERVVEILTQAREYKSHVWLLGNGGSASTCSHFANDLQKVCGVRALCLTDMAPLVLAYGNDEGWQKMFSRALEGYGKPEDVLIIFSCSGYSPNAIEAARVWKDVMIVFTGDDLDSKLIQEAGADVIVNVFHEDIMVQESVHLAMCHAIVEALRATTQTDKVHWVKPGKKKRVKPFQFFEGDEDHDTRA